MGIIYKKCPKCSSLDTINILYGHPTANAMKKAEEGKIKIGGSLKTDGDPEYLCNECGHEWDRQTSIDQAYADIEGMKAEIGGFHSGFIVVKLDFHSRELKWSHRPAFEQPGKKILSSSEIEAFRQKLKEMNFLNWKAEYSDPYILDGTQWSIDILRRTTTLQKYGSNKFPVEWDTFSQAIQDISGQDFD